MKDGQKLLELLFEPNEEVCVSPDEFGYQSIPVSEVSMGSFILSPQTDRQKPRFCRPEDIVLVAINPIKGPRNDENVTAFRTFMVELDDGNLGEQFQYVTNMKMPYSACVFSGGKSLHFAITLTKPLPSYHMWRYYAEWILKIMERADQQTKNPSRGIRFAGNLRNGNEMKAIHIGNRVHLEDLVNWLNQYPGLEPKEQERKQVQDLDLELEFLPDWVQTELCNGINTEKGRNNRWFAIGFECGLLGWNDDDTISLLGQFFQEERDFGRREWETAVKSGIKKAQM